MKSPGGSHAAGGFFYLLLGYYSGFVDAPNGTGQRQSSVRSRQLFLNKSGYNVILPISANQLCCGQPYESKGIQKTQEPILIYSVCSQQKTGETDSLIAIAGACSSKVKIVEEIACCGFGGDRGFSHPELTASALRTLVDQAAGCCSGYSSSKTCEIGLKKHSGISFNNVLQLLGERSEISS